MNFKPFFLLKKSKKDVDLPQVMTWPAGSGRADVASGPQAELTWRAGPPRRYDVALRPRGKTRVAHA